MKSNIQTTSLLIFIQLLITGCVGDSNADNPVPLVNYTVIASGAYSSSGLQADRKIEIFRDQTSLDTSLALHMATLDEYAVDFSSRQVVLLNSVSRSDGHSYGIGRVEDHGDHVKLYAVLNIPGDGCMYATLVSTPYQFVEVGSVKALVVEETINVFNCG